MAKKVVEHKVYSLGRVGTNLQVGIVGLPNVGKVCINNSSLKILWISEWASRVLINLSI